MKLKPEDFRAIKIKNGSTLIFSKENFDRVSNILNNLKENVTEVEVTQKMLDEAQVLIPNKPVKVPEVPEFNYS